MVLTVTMNPSVDISYRLEAFKIDDINRVTQISKTAGGKGLNVARVLADLGDIPSATGFLGGSLGDFIRTELKTTGITDQFFQIDYESRNCIAVIHDGGKQTEILESGPVIDPKDSLEFIEHYTSILKDIDIVTLSGSLPGGLANDYYVQLIHEANQLGKKVILDSSGDSLSAVLKSDDKPFAIKPNKDELEQLFQKPIDDDDSIIDALRNEWFRGIECILVSKGSEGALVKWGDSFYSVRIPRVEVMNPVGSGDATVAGLANALEQGLTPEECMKTAMTAGVLNAMNEQTGKINQKDFPKIHEKIKINKL